MSNIQLRDSTSASGGGNAIITYANITGLANGDLMCAWLTVDVPGTETIPTGWDKQGTISHSGATLSITLYTRERDGTESATETFDGGLRNNVIVGAFYDTTTASPTWAITTPTTNEGTVASQTSAAITSTNNSFLLIGWGNDSALSVTTPPASMTEVAAPLLAEQVSTAAYYEDIITGASETRTLVWSAVEQNVTISTVISSGTGGGGGFDFPFLEPQRIVRHDGRH